MDIKLFLNNIIIFQLCSATISPERTDTVLNKSVEIYLCCRILSLLIRIHQHMETFTPVTHT